MQYIDDREVFYESIEETRDRLEELERRLKKMEAVLRLIINEAPVSVDRCSNRTDYASLVFHYNRGETPSAEWAALFWSLRDSNEIYWVEGHVPLDQGESFDPQQKGLYTARLENSKTQLRADILKHLGSWIQRFRFSQRVE